MSTDSQARVYRGGSVDELIPRIQRELGADAIILRRREGLTGGVLGFFQRSFVEIEAIPGGPRIDIYDEHEGPPAGERAAAPAPLAHESPPATDARPAPSGAPAPSYGAPVAATAGGGALAMHGTYVTDQLAALATASRAEPLPERPRESRTPPVKHVLDSFAAALASAESGPLAPSAPTTRPSSPPPAARAPARPSASRHGTPALAPRAAPASVSPPALAPASAMAQPWSVPPAARGGRRVGVSIERRLCSFGMSEGFARELIETARAHVLPLAPGAGLAGGVRASLAQRIPVAPSLPVRGTAIVVVGAGGSGKTSYCAALMRAYRRAGTLPAGYATLTRDPERAGLQLLLSPHVMRPTPIGAQRALRALRRVRGEGLLVLDTPRLSPADRAGIRELAAMLAELAPQRVVVALPATLGAAAAAQLLAALRPLGANALVVTHADETDQIGVAVEAACAFGLAPEYRLDRSRSGAWRVGRMDPAGLAERLLP
jgi:hypothetical protein